MALRRLAADAVEVRIEDVRIVGANRRAVDDGSRVANVDAIEVGRGSEANFGIARIASLRRQPGRRRASGKQRTAEKQTESEATLCGRPDGSPSSRLSGEFSVPSDRSSSFWESRNIGDRWAAR